MPEITFSYEENDTRAKKKMAAPTKWEPPENRFSLHKIIYNY